MNKGGSGMGVGSASIVLVFAVLCLTVFAIISYTSALADHALVKTEIQLIQSYYEADALAESVLAEIIRSGDVPESVGDIEIFEGWDWEREIYTVSFMCPVSDRKELYVAANAEDGGVLTWKMRDIGGWDADDGWGDWGLWPGDDDGLDLWDWD